MIKVNYLQNIDMFKALVFGNELFAYPQHKQLRSFISGDVEEINVNESKQMPLLIVTPQPTTFDVERSIYYRVFSVGILDLVKPDGSNIDNILNQTEQIAMDIISLMYTIWPDFGIETVSVGEITPVFQKFEDDMAGHIMTVTLGVLNNKCETDIPYSE